MFSLPCACAQVKCQSPGQMVCSLCPRCALYLRHRSWLTGLPDYSKGNVFPFSRIFFFLPVSFQHSPVSNVSSPSSPHPHLSHCQTLLPKTKIASDFSFVRRPRPSKTLAFEACAVLLAGNGAALWCLLQEFIPRSAPGGVGACQGASVVVRVLEKPCLSWVKPAGLYGGDGWHGTLSLHFQTLSLTHRSNNGVIPPILVLFYQADRA